MAPWTPPNPEHAPPKLGEPALMRAARVGDHAELRALAPGVDDIDALFDIALDPHAQRQRASALMVAAGSGYGATVDTVELLIALGADPLLHVDDRSAVGFASGGMGWNYPPGGDVERLHILLAHGGNACETHGGTPVLADACAVADVLRVDALLAAGASPDAPDGHGSWSFQIPLFAAVASGDAACVRRLLDAGADVTVRDESQRTALFFAGAPEIARRLVEAGLSLDDRDAYGWCPVTAAAVDGSLEGVDSLLRAGADPNATHDRAFTVLMSAAASMNRSVALLNRLIEAGADPLATTELGWNALHAAVDVNADAKAESSVRAILGRLVELGVRIDHRDASGMTPLDRARAFGSKLEVMVLEQLSQRREVGSS